MRGRLSCCPRPHRKRVDTAMPNPHQQQHAAQARATTSNPAVNLAAEEPVANTAPAISVELTAGTPPVPGATVTLDRATYDRLMALQQTQTAVREAVPTAASLGSEPQNTDDLGTGRRYADSDLVKVLHGWGRIKANPDGSPKVDYKFGLSKKSYVCVGGVAENVLYSDAKYWQRQWGSKFLKIVPMEATEADYAKVTGIQPMDLARLAAMNEAVDADALLEAWGTERALRFAERITSR